MERNNSAVKFSIILLLVVLVLLYLISLGKLDLLTDDREEKKRKLEEKKKLLENRYDRVQAILARKKTLKTKLETVSKRVLFGVRLGIAIILVSSISIWYSFSSLTLLEITKYLGLATFGLLVLGFVAIGSPTDFFKVWSYLEKKLTLKIYGKYIDIDKHIESHEKELQQILTDKAIVEVDIKEIFQTDIDIKEFTNENNN